MSKLSEKKGCLIGLTGGIASGKSTVTKVLRMQGLTVIDADALVHDLQAPGGRLYQVLVAHFGQEIVQSDGQLDRAALGQRIFGNAEALAWSQETQGAIIRQELTAARDRALTQSPIVFMDIPLLFEQGYADWFDAIWLVGVAPETQLHRLMARNGLTETQAQARLDSQMPLAEKEALADLIIDNNGTLASTRAQVLEALNRLER